MADQYKAILQELCGTAFNYPAGELAELISKTDDDLTADDVKSIGDKIKERYRNTITSINTTHQKKLDENFKAGQRKKAEEIEAALKERLEVESDKTGQDLIDDIVIKVNEKSAKKTGDKITDEDVKKHPFYLRREQEFNKTLNTTKTELEKKITDVQGQQEMIKLRTKATTEGMRLFDAMNPILSEDATKASLQKNILIEKLEGYEYQEVDGKLIPMKDGKTVTDSFGNTLDFDKLVTQTASNYFDFKKAQERQAPTKTLKPGDPGYVDPKTTPNPYTGPLPKTEAEWSKMMNDPNIPITDRKAINEHWTKQTAPAQ